MLRCSSILVLILSVNAIGQSLHRMDAHNGYVPAGKPNQPPTILAIGGQPLELQWERGEQTEAPSVRVDRITNSRRIIMTEEAASASGVHWSYRWNPPETRGTVIYEIQLDRRPESTFRVETRSADRLAQSKSALTRMQWESSALSTQELQALSSLGIATTPASDQSERTFLRMIPVHDTGGRRVVTWHEKDADQVVWQSGPANGDFQILAPRWWLSREALATDQGLIRLLDLFLQVPESR